MNPTVRLGANIDLGANSDISKVVGILEDVAKEAEQRRIEIDTRELGRAYVSKDGYVSILAHVHVKLKMNQPGKFSIEIEEPSNAVMPIEYNKQPERVKRSAENIAFIRDRILERLKEAGISVLEDPGFNGW